MDIHTDILDKHPESAIFFTAEAVVVKRQCLFPQTRRVMKKTWRVMDESRHFSEPYNYSPWLRPLPRLAGALKGATSSATSGGTCL